MRNTISLATVTLLLWGCIEDDIKTIPSFFQVEIDESFSTVDTDNWVFVHDSDGILLQVKRFESGETKVFRHKHVSGDITITFLTINSSGSHSLQSYTGDHINEEWILKGDVHHLPTGSPIGSYVVIIFDDELGDSSNSSVSTAVFDNDVDFVAVDNYVFSSLALTSTMNDVFIFCTDKTDQPLYYFNRNLIPGTGMFTFDNFVEFDKAVEIKFPASDNYYIETRGFAEGQAPNRVSGFVLNQYLNSGEGEIRSSFTLGYLDQFSQSLTRATISYDDFDLGVEAFGSHPTSDIVITNAISSELMNTSFGNFDVSAKEDFDWHRSAWVASNSSSSVEWQVVGSTASLVNHQTIPDVIKEEYPIFEELTFNHLFTTVYDGDWSYTQFIGNEFKGEALTPYTLSVKTLR